MVDFENSLCSAKHNEFFVPISVINKHGVYLFLDTHRVYYAMLLQSL